MAREQMKFDSTMQMRLFDAALDLFARYGYEGTTVRMIAKKAGTSAGQVAFYFGSKENLYLEIRKHIANQTRAAFDPMGEEVRQLELSGKLDRVTALDYLHLIINVQIDFALDPDNYNDLMIIFTQRMDAPADHDEVAGTITGTIEQLTADLLIAASDNKMSELKARTISRAINGAIISFGEHPELLMNEIREVKDDAFIKLHLANFIRSAVNEAITGGA